MTISIGLIPNNKTVMLMQDSEISWGVIGLTQGLAREWGRYSINVNAIAPGFVATDQAIRTCKQSNTPLDYHKNQSVLGKLGEVSDVANLVLFLASENSKFITGQAFLVNGGSLII